MLCPLEIHHINVSQGDCTLIIHRDLTALHGIISKHDEDFSKTSPPEDFLPYAIKEHLDLKGTVLAAVLIDGGDYDYYTDVTNYLEMQGIKGTVGDNRDFFCTILTHRHADHINGLRGAFWEVKTTDRPECELYSFKDKYEATIELYPKFPPGKIYDDNKSNKDVKKSTGCSTTYNNDLEYLTSPGKYKLQMDKAISQRIHITPSKEISLGTYTLFGSSSPIPITLKCVYANGELLLDSATGFKEIPPNLKTYFKNTATFSVDPNVLSVCLVLEFGNFRYFLGGDIAGNGQAAGGNEGAAIYAPKNSFSKHPDTETELTSALRNLYPEGLANPKTPAGHMCGFKVSHHGSGSSSDTYFLSTIRPCMAVISSGFKEKYHEHPHQETLNRIDHELSPQWNYKKTQLGKADEIIKVANTIKSYYITEMANHCSETKYLTRNFPKGKILGDIILRPDVETVSGKPKIQIYGTGIQSDPVTIIDEATDPATQIIVRDAKPCHASPKAPYSIGPELLTCDSH